MRDAPPQSAPVPAMRTIRLLLLLAAISPLSAGEVFNFPARTSRGALTEHHVDAIGMLAEHDDLEQLTALGDADLDGLGEHGQLRPVADRARPR